MPGVCGIGAILDPNGLAPAHAGARMTAALRHRGPDGEGVLTKGPATLAHTRLAFIGVESGEQPLVSEDGSIAAIVNGEIYNHLELRAELEEAGHVFATETDSEVIVHGYEQHGTAFVKRLNGFFAFALWDDRKRRLVAARDEFGIKPLYWTQNGSRLALASEIGALTAAGLATAAVDRIALDHFLAARFVPAPRTLFEGVSKLAPAGLLIAEPGSQPRIETFREAPGEPIQGASTDELANDLATRFTRAVEGQMMSEVPFGAFLSGGIDSAAIVAAMSATEPDPIETFTMGFHGHDPAFDERARARETADALDTDHHEITMAADDFLAELQRCVRRLEEPVGIPSAPALMQLSRFAARDVKMVLSGQGADEPHGGYGRHQAAGALQAAAAAGPLAAPLGRLATRAAPGNDRVRRAARLLGKLTPAQRLTRLVEFSTEEQRAALTGGSGEQAAAERVALAEGVLADVADRGMVEQALYLDSHMFLGDSLLICADKMSMSASLEQRVPFLDNELMRFVETIPARERVRPRQGKRLHRQAMQRVIPPGLGERPRHGWTTPYEEWLRSSLGTEVSARYAPGTPMSELIEPKTVDRLVRDHQSGIADHKLTLYCLLELSQWHRHFIEGETQA